MRCSNCGTENAAGSRFCNQCATPFSRKCAKCAFGNASEAKFCAQCAAPLGATIGAPESTTPRGRTAGIPGSATPTEEVHQIDGEQPYLTARAGKASGEDHHLKVT